MKESPLRGWRPPPLSPAAFSIHIYCLQSVQSHCHRLDQGKIFNSMLRMTFLSHSMTSHVCCHVLHAGHALQQTTRLAFCPTMDVRDGIQRFPPIVLVGGRALLADKTRLRLSLWTNDNANDACRNHPICCNNTAASVHTNGVQ